MLGTTTSRLSADARLLHRPGDPQVDGPRGRCPVVAVLLGEAKQQRHAETARCLLRPAWPALSKRAAPRRLIKATAIRRNGALVLPPSSERRCAPLRTTALISRRRGTGRLQGRRGSRPGQAPAALRRTIASAQSRASGPRRPGSHSCSRRRGAGERFVDTGIVRIGPDRRCGARSGSPENRASQG